MKILIVQHTVGEGPGLLQPVLLCKGWELDIRCMEEPGTSLPCNLDGYDAMLILGGPMGANEEDKYPYLRILQKLIVLSLQTGIPVLGICLGAQIIAKALGGSVKPNQVKEIGWYRLHLTGAGQQSPLFEGLPEELTFFEWHQDTFSLPESASHLVEGGTCTNQAFSINDSLWGLQFHPEVNQSIIFHWSKNGADELEEFGGKDEPSRLRVKTLLNWENSKSIRITFLENIEKVLRKRPLPGAFN